MVNRIFYMRFDTNMADEEIDLFMQCLPIARRERVMRLKGRESSIKCLQTGLFLRYCLEICGVKHTIDDLLIGEDEKPYLRGNSVYFNMSHSDEYVVICVSDQDCGIDLQKRMGYKERLAKRIMHEKEWQYVDNISELTQKEQLINLCWCAKEAYLKYTGEGIRHSMSELDMLGFLMHFCMQTDTSVKVTPEQNGVFMRFHMLEDNYFLAVCQKENFVQPLLEKVDINQMYSSMKSLYLSNIL